MDRYQFEHILICSLDYSKDEYKNLVDEFVQIEMYNSLSLMSDVKAVGLCVILLTTIILI